ncbi:MAG: dihydroorotase [Verrucomicrobia bacterium]|nr:dihydroorotase [Verrucomicrobiota bacterium]
MKSCLLVQGRLIDPSQSLDTTASILIEEGKIAALGGEADARAEADTTRLNAAGLVITPGLIDLHVHLREPGQSAKETIATGTAAAARGGFTTVVCMPNTKPAIHSASEVAFVLERAERHGHVRVRVAGAITKEIAGTELAPIGSLKRAGVVAITDDGHCVQNNELMRRALEYAGMFDLPLMDHCQDYSLVSEGKMHEGYWSSVLGLQGWPSSGEELIVARDILLAELTGTPIHCQHISAAGSVRLLREAKGRGVPISGEACPHHFVLTDAAVAGSEAFWKADGDGVWGAEAMQPKPAWPAYDTRFKMNPPLRSSADRLAILEGLVDGTLEVLASDHAPHVADEKDVEFDHAPFGITGLETELALSLMQLYHAGRLPLARVIEKFTSVPAKVLRLRDKGTLAVGVEADLTVMDPEAYWSLGENETLSKAINCPFFDWKLRGRALATMVGGRFVWNDWPELTRAGVAAGLAPLTVNP